MISVLFRTLNAAARRVVPANGVQVIPNFGLSWSLLTSSSPLRESKLSPSVAVRFFRSVDVRVCVPVEVLEIQVGHLPERLGSGRPDRRVLLAIDTEESAAGLQVEVPRGEKMLELDAESSFGNLDVEKLPKWEVTVSPTKL